MKTLQEIENLAKAQGITLPEINTAKCNEILRQLASSKSQIKLLKHDSFIMMQAFAEINYPMHQGQGRHYTTNNGAVFGFYYSPKGNGICVMS